MRIQSKPEMFICEQCGYETDHVERIHGLYEDYYDTSCPICRDAMELTDRQCAVCKKFISEATNDEYGGLCFDCADQLKTSFERILENLIPAQKEYLIEYVHERYWV